MTTIALAAGDWPENERPGRVDPARGRRALRANETTFVGIEELLTAAESAPPQARRQCVSWHAITHQLFYGRRSTACRVFGVLLMTTAVLVAAAMLLGETGLQTAVGLIGFIYMLRYRQHQLTDG
ncbi:hypothetical protein [Amycolatopsis sp. 195334CR]|uniref:hypothetical protein n=1 Tax=Amycolatopsis sp. 195334CR TaxID=2814588 RepID=UPI001A8F5A73|nr:hypothetical protein [Amycolatopsis sp. 195334CR]MBN6035240.1 hypothetical protein [Amycolatopsis sp. 195334CR]